MPSELESEQQVVDALYRRLDEVEQQAERSLERAVSGPTAGTPGAQTERDAYVRMYRERLASLRAAHERLCFGRLDLLGGEVRYLGRLGLSDEQQQPVLTDWRAPAAEPFYQATSASPGGVVRRRHIVTSGREVTSLEDDVLDLEAFDGDLGRVQGGGALMAALGAKRTGRMRDIVSTIQAEQDRIIRSPLRGVLVVEGGPGCGKTVVALHRAAYLLYTHRDRLARSGVLVVGPNRVFLHYIEQVLPALGETSAVLVTPGQLMPDVEATGDDADGVAAVKGDLRMLDVLHSAVRARQRVPEAAIPLDVQGTRIMLTPAMVEAARSRARSSRKPHNLARRVFVLDLLERLSVVLARARGVDRDSQRDILDGDLRDSPDVRREINLCWMPLTPMGVLAGLFADPRSLAEAGRRLSSSERTRLERPRGSRWTVSDVPLLDELAELLGEDDEEQRALEARGRRERAREEEYARGVLEMTGQSDVTAEHLIERYSAQHQRRTVAEHAAVDRTWTFGHVVVDEAQELSPMAWHVLFRRCPSRSMTVVGDLDQTSSGAGMVAWSDVFDRFARGSWRTERLTVNYRTPAPVMELAGEVLKAHGRTPSVSASAREGEQPVVRRTGGEGLVTTLLDLVRQELEREPGRLCIITPRGRLAQVQEATRERFGDRVGSGEATLDAQVSVLTATSAKGLEFDTVVLLEPAEVLGESSRGPRDLYVALTRPTSRLAVVHAAPLPPGMEALAQAGT